MSQSQPVDQSPALSTDPARESDHDLEMRRARRHQAIASAALEGIAFTAEYLAELDRFDQERLTAAERAAYLIKKHRPVE